MALPAGRDRSEPESRTLVERAANGEAAASAELYIALRAPVRALCRRLLRSDGDAEEAAADVLLRIERLARDYDDSITFRGFVLRAATNHCIDRLRRRRLERRWIASVAGTVETTSPSPSPLSRLVGREHRDRVRAAIRTLPDVYRVVLVLRYYRELSYDEIAERLQMPRATVGTALFRAKALLRSRLGSAEP